MTIDDQSTEFDIAGELGFRIVSWRDGNGKPEYQYQKVNAQGVTTACQPTHPHAYALWVKLVSTLKDLATALENGGEEGGDYQPKSPAPRMA